MEKLTQEKLKEVLDYDPVSGIFVWKERFKKNGEINSCSWKRAGTSTLYGYIVIGINGTLFFAHRLAWLFVYGYFPENGIGHINHKKSDNRIENLHEATRSCSLQNKRICVKNKSGITGVSLAESSGKWIVKIKNIYLGTFPSLLEAAKVRYAGELKHFDCVVNSSAKSYIDREMPPKGGD